MASSKPVEPKDNLGQAIFKDIQDYTSKGEAVPSDEKAYNVSMRKTGVSPLDYRIGRPSPRSARRQTKD